MTDIELVIKIPEEKLSIIKNKRYCGLYDSDLYKAIANGISLPKEHGRLIDADKLTENILCQTFGLRSVDIDNAPTIIEADKAENNERIALCFTDCEQESILDKIKAEIEATCHITVGRENNPAITLYDVFKIIDKYKAESEVNNG